MIILTNDTKRINENTCVALGNFDGVHKGHRKLISSLTEYATLYSLKSCVYTFKTHPANILGFGKALLTENNEKIQIIDSLCCDYMYLEEFTDVRDMSPEDFCRYVIFEKLNAKCVFCGENYKFGKEGKGDITTLKSELLKLGINLIVVPYIRTSDGEIVSSTKIREQLKSGNLQTAHSMLGYNYSLSGTVIQGKQLGRKLGFPTVNMPISATKLIPKYGVYISECLVDGKKFNSITNIGIRPTVDKDIPTVNCETYIFDYTDNAYKKNITVSLISMIRSEMKFDSVEHLSAQIKDDIMCAKQYFQLNNRSIQ